MKETGPIRSALFVPGNRPDRVDKAVGAGADAVIIDLEDAVAAAQKEQTRPLVREKLLQHGRSLIFVRVNGLETGFIQGDLEEVVVETLGGIMLPKVEEAAHMREINDRLLAVERARSLPEGALPVIPLIESARAVQNIFEIVSEQTRPRRIFTVAFGAADYALDLGIELTKEATELFHPRSVLPVACRAAGIEPPIDTPFMIDLKDRVAFETDAKRAKALGFQGKLCIHPSQVGPCNALFGPSEEEIEHARKVVAAFEEAEAAGSAAIQVEGKFVDYAVVERARRILRIAERLHIQNRGA